MRNFVNAIYINYQEYFKIMLYSFVNEAFILMAHFRNSTWNPDGSWSHYLQSYIEQFFKAFPDLKYHKLISVKRSEGSTAFLRKSH